MIFGSNGKNRSGSISAQTRQSFITLKEVVKRYESAAGAITALNEIELRVQAGEFLSVTGKSGAGKTTLVNMISGLDTLSGGEIWIGETPIHDLNQNQAARWRSRNVGIVFQAFQLLPGLTVLQNVMLPMDFIHTQSLRQRKERALFLLEQVGIAEHASKRPAAVSGGQQQRIAIARALANDPPLLLADEPTGSLDSATRQAVFNVFAGLAELGKTVILVTHDRDLASQTGRTVTLRDGRIVNDTQESEVEKIGNIFVKG